MALSEFGALTREFYIAEIGTWENYGGKRVWWFIAGNITRFYCICILNMVEASAMRNNNRAKSWL